MEDRSMELYRQRVKRIKRFSLIVLIFFALGMLTPFSSHFAGLFLGTFVSLFNSLLLARKVDKLGEYAADFEIHNKKRPLFSGMITRFSTSVIAIMIVYNFPQHIHLFSTLIGLFVTQIIIVADGIRHH